MYKNIFKPLFDFFFALIAILLLSPILLVVGVVLFFSNKGNPFFFQRRPGKDGRIFKIVKFKTMTDEKDEFGQPLPDAERLTRAGKRVRQLSLDEVPQLINVLKGEMSFVGPRPLLPEYLGIYTKHQKRRHEVRPGITGWAQINGRNAISWKKKLELDVWYVDHISFFLDLKILFGTIIKVLRSEGINSDNMATTEPFNGNN